MSSFELFFATAALCAYVTLLITLRASHREIDQLQAELDRMREDLELDR